MSDDGLRERIEKAMRERAQAHGLLICTDDAVSVALAEVERERKAFQDALAIEVERRDAIDQRAEAAEKALDRERVRLAGCGVAAQGGVKEPVPEYGDSASLQDVLRLYARMVAAETEREDLRMRAEYAEQERDETIAAQEIQATAIRKLTKERDEARKALAEWGHAANCRCLAAYEPPSRGPYSHPSNRRRAVADPRCAPEVKPERRQADPS